MPGHSKAAQPQVALENGAMMMDDAKAPQSSMEMPSEEAEETEAPVASSKPLPKPRKIEKQMAKREALLASKCAVRAVLNDSLTQPDWHRDQR